jgi:hypothetical protein
MSRYAICIGIDDYDNLPEGWDSLEFASSDARAIAEVLADPARGAFDRVELLTKPAQTTLSGLIDALKQLFFEIRPDNEDTVLLYFACHCGIDRQEKLYLIPSDGRANQWGIPDMASMLRIDTLNGYFSESHSRNLVLVLDMAYAEENTNLARRIRLIDSPNFFTVGSVISSKIIDELHMLKHSPFSYALLKAFKQPHSPDGWLRISDIQTFISQNLREILDVYWAAHSQMLIVPSAFFEDVRLFHAVPESAEFTREVKMALQRNGYRILTVNGSDPRNSRLRAEISVAFTRSVVEVLALDNTRVNWSVEQAQKFMEQIERLRLQGDITHALVISSQELAPDVADTLRRWQFELMTLDDVVSRA